MYDGLSPWRDKVAEEKWHQIYALAGSLHKALCPTREACPGVDTHVAMAHDLFDEGWRRPSGR